ncbi:hypothetical protein SS50377_26914 [Spironucleus salmonicida]|uniref:Uncharacterized protein n=1 Tax=Spironucleus salmonicida TaxID=348837 RepID=V6LS74_9EUKA|nr:hypothetical protein SS50377_26914 [Spironucleus salmonicida]|eukprot:EST47425.1 hypothetical protein SS50377_12410 [Spironucleus salmonicida]
MPPKPQISESLDWSKSSEPLPYIFEDLENAAHELSETFLPGDQSAQYISTFHQAFSFIFDFTQSQLLQIQQGNMSIITPECFDNALKQPKSGIQAILALILGYYDAGETTITSVVEKSLVISNIIDSLAAIFIQEAQTCLVALEDPPQDQKATHQLTSLLINIIQLLHLLITSQNLSNNFIGSGQVYLKILNISSQLLISLSGISLSQPPQTFLMSNARCFAGSRVICLIRQTLIRLLGMTKELKSVDKILAAKIKNEEKTVKRLPAPRFYGFANPICQQIQQLELISKVDVQYGDIFTDIQPVLHSYWNDENMMEFIDFYDKIQQKRRGIMTQECDVYNKQRNDQIQSLFNQLSNTEMKGSLEGIEQNHAAYVSMKLASDGRTQSLVTQNQTPISQQNSGRFPGQINKNLQSEATEIMKNKFQSSYTKSFQYSGRAQLISKASQNILQSIDYNLLGFEQSNIDLNNVKRKFKDIGPLDLQSSILKQKLVVNQLSNVPSYSNIYKVLQQFDIYQFLHSIARFGLCSIPNTADVINNRHNIPEPGQPPSNNSVASIRHVREIVLKQVSYINYQLIYVSKQVHPALHRYLAKYYSNIPELYEYLICVISQPLGIYSSTFDQRQKSIGQCLFELQPNVLSTSELFSHASEIIYNTSSSQLNPQTPLASFSSTRRLFILNSVFRSIYGTIQHSRKRQSDFNKLYNKISANYVSSIMQSASNALQQNIEEDTSQISLSQTINKQKLQKAIGGLSDFNINSKKQTQSVLDPLSVASLIEFLSGQNANNNPQRQNMACTISCTFPGYQALRVNNLGLIGVFLKLSLHLLPASSGSENGDFSSVFEVPGLQSAREAVIKSGWLSGISAKSVDCYRWNRDSVCSGEAERDFQESRVILEVLGQQLDMQVISETIKNGYCNGYGASVVDAELGFVGKLK